MLACNRDRIWKEKKPMIKIHVKQVLWRDFTVKKKYENFSAIHTWCRIYISDHFQDTYTIGNVIHNFFTHSYKIELLIPISTTYFLQNHFLTFEMLDRIFTDQCKGICHRQSDKFTGLPNVEPFATISGVVQCTKNGKILQ